MSIGGVLLPYQQRWLADTCRVKVCEKSRRIGLTWCQAADDVLLAAAEGDAGMDVLYISYDKDMTREYIDTCGWWAKHFNNACGEVEEFLFVEEDPEGDRSILAFRIHFASGKDIVALSSSPRALRGKQGRVVIDEDGGSQAT
jgi:phage FluMu gp28-like protein